MSATRTPRRGDDTAAAVAGNVVAVTTLRLRTAAHFGGGEGDSTDAQILRDADGIPFIPGASLAGACRAQLRGLSKVTATDLELLFGGWERPADDADAEPARPRRVGEWYQSALIVDDAFPAGKSPLPALRDHVRLDPSRRTAAVGGKFDHEVLEPGSAFTLRLELPLRRADGDRRERLRTLFNAVLDALQYGDIRLGAHTRRGLGQIETDDWRVLALDFQRPADARRWLQDVAPDERAAQRWGEARAGSAIGEVGARRHCYVSATLTLQGPILVRATPPGDALDAPDSVQLRSAGRPVVPGSSLAGALRHRARRICRILASDQARADALVDGIFGPGFRDGSPPLEHRASRLRVDEATITGGRRQRQTRIAIDRFTGGTMPTALLEEMPEWPDDSGTTALQVSYRLDDRPEAGQDESAFEAGCGLLLLLLKDLCTGDLTVGGGTAIGRGVLRGRSGRIELGGESRRVWTWQAQGGALELSDDPALLEQWVAALGAHLRGAAR